MSTSSSLSTSARCGPCTTWYASYTTTYYIIHIIIYNNILLYVNEFFLVNLSQMWAMYNLERTVLSSSIKDCVMSCYVMVLYVNEFFLINLSQMWAMYPVRVVFSAIQYNTTI